MHQGQLNFDPAPPLVPDADPCARKHQGNEQSRAAFAKAQPGIRKAHADILAWLRERGRGTALEYAAAVGKAPNEVSGRFSELRHRLHLIRPTGVRRDGAMEYEAC